MTGFAELATECPEEDYDLVRELLSYEMRCPISCIFHKDDKKALKFYTVPSPLHWSRQIEWPWVLRHAGLKKTDRVLDIGSGWSVLKFALAKRCRSVTCLEVDPTFIEKAEQAIQVLEAFNITQVLGDARALPFPDHSFDHVFSCSVFEHMPSGHIPAVREALRVLKPGGTFFLTMDVVISGTPGSGNNFYIDTEQTARIMEVMGIYEVKNQGQAIGAALEEGVQVVVVLAKTTKEVKP